MKANYNLELHSLQDKLHSVSNAIQRTSKFSENHYSLLKTRNSIENRIVDLAFQHSKGLI